MSKKDSTTVERRLIVIALFTLNGDVDKAAKYFGTSKEVFQEKMDFYGISLCDSGFHKALDMFVALNYRERIDVLRVLNGRLFKKD